MRKYTLRSSDLIGAPGFVGWCINGWKHTADVDRERFIRLIRDTWDVPHSVASLLVRGEVNYVIQNGSVEFEV